MMSLLKYLVPLLAIAGCTQTVRVGPYNKLAEKLPDGSIRAIGLASFEGIEEPEIVYYPAADRFRADEYPNIVDVGQRTVRMTLRYHPDWWDGDRDIERNKDRQRAEVKGLGPHQKLGETFQYSTTWRSNPGFHGSERFCHIFQLKATEGDKGAPLVTLSIRPGEGNACVQYWSGDAKGFTVARSFTFRPGQWQTVRVRIRTSEQNDGEVTASVDGDAFQGVRNVAVYRRNARDYRPKWGLYRGVNRGMDLGEDWVEHRDVSARVE